MVFLIFAFCLIICIPTLYVFLSAKKYIHSITETPAICYSLILGAGIRRDGNPTNILADRVLTACHLYHAGKTEYLIMSGTNHTLHYNETAAMRNFALQQQIPSKAILLDGKGFSTFQSLLNTRNNQSPDEIILVTQNFHLPRAIFLARAFKMKPVGIPARIYQFSFLKKLFWSLREAIAIPVNIFRIVIFYFRIGICKSFHSH